ncbi:MAG: site-specific integrase [Saccharothrix sp.]|nr:site-specific integrase [Saccharothrix sp.]
MGVEPEDLREAVGERVPVPTYAEVLPAVAKAVPEKSRTAYGTYWGRIEDRWGDRRVDTTTVADVVALFEWTRENVVVRRSANGGASAVLHTYEALRCVFRYCVEQEILTARQNVMDRVTKPPRPKSRRHALTPRLWAEIDRAARSGGLDPNLDALVLRFHLETACRTGGALNVRVKDLDADQCLVRLTEKGEKARWQPVSPTLMKYLLHHAHERGARDPGSRVLRFLNGTPLTKRRYENMWNRIGKQVDSVQVLGISAHWLRHTTLTWVERNFGIAVARAYSGHVEPNSNRQGTTYVYTKASLGEVATALQALTNEPHPLAIEGLWTPPDTNARHPLQGELDPPPY